MKKAYDVWIPVILDYANKKLKYKKVASNVTGNKKMIKVTYWIKYRFNKYIKIGTNPVIASGVAAGLATPLPVPMSGIASGVAAYKIQDAINQKATPKKRFIKKKDIKVVPAGSPMPDDLKVLKKLKIMKDEDVNFGDTPDKKWDVWLLKRKRKLGSYSAGFKEDWQKIASNITGDKSSIKKRYFDMNKFRTYIDEGHSLAKGAAIGAIAGSVLPGIGTATAAALGSGVQYLRNRLARTGVNNKIKPKKITSSCIKVLPAGSPDPGKSKGFL